LKCVGIVDIEAWCLPSQEPHREDEYPRQYEDYPDDINFMICNLNNEQVTQEQINEARRIGEREGRLQALSKLTDDQNKELRRREILTYKRKNSPAPLSQPNTSLPPVEKAAPPYPSSLCELFTNLTPTDDIQLNIDVANMFGKLNMTVLVTEMCKIPSVKRKILRILQVPTEKEDPPIILNTMYLDQPRDKNPPFYLSLGMNGLCLNNYMLDSGTSTNVISLKVMTQLSLKTTRPYGNVCGIDLIRVEVWGVCEDVEVFLIDFPHISVLMDILVIDVPDVWGMLLSRT
jgi:hypothetical protein